MPLNSIHDHLPPLTDEIGRRSYAEMATDQLRRIVVDIGVQLSGTPQPLDIGQLQQRIVYILALIEAHDPTIPRYSIDAAMPFSGRDDQTLTVTKVDSQPALSPNRTPRRQRNRDR